MQEDRDFFTNLLNQLHAMSPPTTYHHQNQPTSCKPTLAHQPILVTQSTPTPPPVLTPPASDKPSVILPTITKTMTMKPETKPKKKSIQPLPVLTPEPNIQTMIE